MKTQSQGRVPYGRSISSCDNYMSSALRVPLLTPSEELILGAAVKKMMDLTKEKEESEYTQEDKRIIKVGRKAKNRMIEANIRLVATIAQKYAPARVHLEIEDLMQEGILGLARAVEMFDHGRGYKFSTYAYWWILQAIQRAIETQEMPIRHPSYVQQIIRKSDSAKVSFFQKHGREPSIKEIAEIIKEDESKVLHAYSKRIVVGSLDFSFDSTSRATEGSQDVGKKMEYFIDMSNAEVLDKENTNSQLDAIMFTISCLPDEERELICKRYGIGIELVPIKDLAEQRGVSRAAISDRVRRITRKIKTATCRFVPST